MNPIVSVILYRDGDGTQLRLEVPWEDQGSGRIPPPMITFYLGGQAWDFVYSGPEEK